MASLYGKHAYGRGYYSDAHRDVAGDFDVIAPAFAGRFTKSHPVEGTFSTVPSFASVLTKSQPVEGTFSIVPSFAAILTESQPLVGTFSVIPSFAGILLDINNFSGDLPIDPVFSGELFRAAEREIEATMSISLDFAGLFGIDFHFEGGFDVEVTIAGGDDIYIGPYWVPITEDTDTWTPVERASSWS